MTTKIHVLFYVLLLAAMELTSTRATHASQQAYDLQEDFSHLANPNGAWQYGWLSALGDELQLFTNTSFFSNNALVRLGGGGGDANVHANLTGQVVIDSLSYPPRAVTIHPGAGGQFGAIDWVAPLSGTATVEGRFVGLHNATTDTHVYIDGVSQFQGFIQGNGDTKVFELTVPFSLQAGDRIRFAIGYGANGNYEQDTTRVEAKVVFTPVPEPAASLLAVLALAATKRTRRYRKREKGA